jgi:hypothetical protein
LSSEAGTTNKEEIIGRIKSMLETKGIHKEQLDSLQISWATIFGEDTPENKNSFSKNFSGLIKDEKNPEYLKLPTSKKD